MTTATTGPTPASPQPAAPAWIWIAQPGFQVSARRDLTGINWYAGEAVDWSLVRYAQ